MRRDEKTEKSKTEKDTRATTELFFFSFLLFSFSSFSLSISTDNFLSPNAVPESVRRTPSTEVSKTASVSLNLVPDSNSNVSGKKGRREEREKESRCEGREKEREGARGRRERR